MLDINFITENVASVQRRLDQRNRDQNYTELLNQAVQTNLKRKQYLQKVEQLRFAKNELSKEISQLLKNHGDQALVESQIAQVKAFNHQIQETENAGQRFVTELTKILQVLPNLPDASVPVGSNEQGNLEVKKAGTILKHTNLPHWEIGQKLGLVAFDLGVKLSGSRFLVYTNRGAKMVRALADILLNQHVQNGYQEFVVPLIVNEESLYGTGQLPKFADDLYALANDSVVASQRTNQYLIPTAEVVLTNFHANEILDGQKLPLKYTAFTQCFRKEAGAAGRDTKGMIRLHQFNKVELVKIVKPTDSMRELELLLQDAEQTLQLFSLPYRVVNLCTGDLGFSAVKTYDIEVWFPNQQQYREISSCSNCGDFQARNMKTRYREPNAVPQLVHTLNGSALAIDRLFAAILENYWDGQKLVLPPILKPYFNNQDFLEAN